MLGSYDPAGQRAQAQALTLLPAPVNDCGWAMLGGIKGALGPRE
jgi:hypothetical protein